MLWQAIRYLAIPISGGFSDERVIPRRVGSGATRKARLVQPPGHRRIQSDHARGEVRAGWLGHMLWTAVVTFGQLGSRANTTESHRSCHASQRDCEENACIRDGKFPAFEARP
jgi:hypothetical protein